MAKNKGFNRTTEDLRGISDYYKLHTKAVDELVGTDQNNVRQYSEEELKKYRRRAGIELPQWLKVVLIKAWFAGAVCFFIFWGLGMYVADMLDMLVVFGIVLGLATDLLVNGILRFSEQTPGANNRWMMFPKKSLLSFFLNIPYACLLLFFVYTIYQLINGILVMLTGAVDRVPLGVEPILFGLFYTAMDMLLIGMKHLFGRIVSDARKRA